MSILDYTPSHLPNLRQLQVDVLLEVERKWDRYDVFIINAPVAAGKSLLANTIASWSGNAAVLVPNNMLRNQYYAEYPDMQMIRRRGEYYCTTLEQSVDKTYKKHKKLCQVDCLGCSKYREDVDKIEAAPLLLANYYGYTGYARVGSQKSTLIVDEAHNLGNMLRELAGKKLWRHEANYPASIHTRLDMMQWAETIPEHEMEEWPLLRLFHDEVLSDKPRYVFEITTSYHGKKSVDADDKLPLIKMLPVDTRGLDVGSDFLWPPGVVRKIILLSATISDIDIAQFGLGQKRICKIEAASPIPLSRRPVVLAETRASMAFKYQEANIPLLLDFVRLVAAENEDKKGLIHVPYSLAQKLQVSLGEDTRFIFHGRGRDKLIKYQEFRDSTEPKILVASGMAEGVDLPGDLCRFQIITKMPYPSLADPALRYMAGANPDWYGWQAVKDLIQASGRVCRGPDDYGITYIFDSCFVGLYERSINLIPSWFGDAVIWPEK